MSEVMSANVLEIEYDVGETEFYRGDKHKYKPDDAMCYCCI